MCKRGVEDDSQIFDLSPWKDTRALYRNRADCREGSAVVVGLLTHLGLAVFEPPVQH